MRPKTILPATALIRERQQNTHPPSQISPSSMELQYLAPALKEFCVDEIQIVVPNPNPNPDRPSNPSLAPTTSIAFKREARKKRRERKRQRKLQQKLEQELDSLLAIDTNKPPPSSSTHSLSTIEWPCNDSASDPNPQPTEWAWALPIPDPNPEPKDQAMAPTLQAQHKVLRQCQDFLALNDDGPSSDDDDESGRESGPFEFLVELFEKNGDLREFYGSNWEKGEFSCLICGGIGEKLGKRFVNAVGLVQHANTVWKTKRIKAHRAFARAVCRVLGWDINKLPNILKEGIQEMVDTDEEGGVHKGDDDLVGPFKRDLMDCTESDSNSD